MGASIWQPGGPSVPAVDPNSQIKSQQFTATASQTLFPITLFTYVTGANAIDVYRNGLKVPKSGVIETSSASFTLVTPCSVGDVVEVVGNTVVADAGNSAVAAHNSELAAVEAATTAVAAKNQAVSSAAAAAASAAISFMTWRASWVTATLYKVNDGVSNNGTSYVCVSQHTSGTFVTDLAAGRWQILAAKGVDGTGTGDMLKANNLSELPSPVAARSNLGLGTAATQASEAFAQGVHDHTDKVSQTSSTGSAILPAGTTAQRDVAPAAGYKRFNTTLGKEEVWNGSAWVSGGGAVTQGDLAPDVVGTGPAFITAINTQAVSTSIVLACTVRKDTNNCFRSNRFTPNIAGYYIMTASIITNQPASTALVRLRKNSAELVAASASPGLSSGEGGGSFVSTTGISYFNGTTDYIEVLGAINIVGYSVVTGNFSGYLGRAA